MQIEFRTKYNGIYLNVIYIYIYSSVRMVHCIYLGVTGYNFPKNISFLSPNIAFYLANSADPDENCAAFNLGLHCLS